MGSYSYITNDGGELFISQIYGSTDGFCKHMKKVFNNEIKQFVPDRETFEHKLDWFENEYAPIRKVEVFSDLYRTSIDYITGCLTSAGELLIEYETSESGKSYLMALIHTPVVNATDCERKSLRFIKHDI